MTALIKIIALVLLFNSSCFAANYCVRPSSAGSNTGADWSNAYGIADLVDSDSTMPNGVTKRGNTFYISGESYSSALTFAAPVSGSTYIYIKKATSSDHVSETGWSSAYGSNAANFLRWNFSTSYWDIDGVTGGGPTAWTTGHGIKVNGTDARRIEFNTSASYVIVKRAEIYNNDKSTSAAFDDLVYSYSNSTNVTFQRCYIHTVYGGCFGSGYVGIDGWTIEYSKVGDNVGTPAMHSEIWACMGNDDWTWRYNYLYQWRSTGCLICINGGGTTYEDVNIVENLKIYGNIFDQDYIGGPSSIIRSFDEGVGASNRQIGRGWRVYNNTFVNIDNGASTWNVYIVATSGTKDNEFVNNIIFSEDIDIGGAAGGWFDRENYNSYKSGLSTYVLNGANDSAISDPFTAISGYNYTLRSGLAGVALSSPYNTDMLGNTRGADGVFDRGAYEYGVGGGDVTAPTVTSVSVNGSTATINFSETVVTTGYDTGDFNIDCTSPTLTSVALSSPSGSGSTRTFTIATPIVYGQACNLDYVGSVGDITDAASSPNSMVAANDISVTNLTGAEFVESGWYTQIADTALLPGYAAYGTTIMLPYNGAYSPSSIPTYLDAAAAVGIKVWVDLRIEALALSESAFKAIINTNKNHSALKGWYISDEPELGGTSPATVEQYYGWAKSQDPYHPVAIAHANAPDAAYVDGYDVLVIDYYPGWTVSLPAEYNWMVRASYSRWKAGVDFAATYGKTFIPAGLGFGYKISDGTLNNGVRDLTYGEYRYHVFSGIVQGVPAYLFWMDEWANANVLSLVGQMINQINDISVPMRAGTTNSSSITCSQPTSKIQYRYGVVGNVHTLLAVNIAGYNVSDAGETLNNVTFTLPSGASTVSVLDESRTLTPSSNIITDNFSRFQVHVYQWTTTSGDYTPAVIDNLSPSGTLACTSNPRSVTLSHSTNEYATSRMSDVSGSVAYIDMTDTFTNTNSTNHSEAKSLACGATYNYWIRTSDAAGNVNAVSELITFSIASPQIAGPGGMVITGGRLR